MFLVGTCWLLVVLYETNFNHSSDIPVEESIIDPLSDLENNNKLKENEPLIHDNDNIVVDNVVDVKEQVEGEGEKEAVQENRKPEEPVHEEVHQQKQENRVIEAPLDPNGPGEMGRAVKLENLDPETKKLVDKGWQDNAFNQYVSDLISLDRTLPDYRWFLSIICIHTTIYL